MEFRRLCLNGGQVFEGNPTRLVLPPAVSGYADAQIDDYGHAGGRAHYPWRPGTRLALRARFSHDRDSLLGTAGFGFWNAPFGDPTQRWPALPQATWFFFASAPSDLPFAECGPGRGWFAATVDAAAPRAVLSVPLAPIVLLLNQSQKLKKAVWPPVRRLLQISWAPIGEEMTSWHDFELCWMKEGCRFVVDGRILLQTAFSPRGPLGFVCWLDNQYMVATPRGRFRAGHLEIAVEQTLEIADLSLERA